MHEPGFAWWGISLWALMPCERPTVCTVGDDEAFTLGKPFSVADYRPHRLLHDSVASVAQKNKLVMM